jgi:tRNA-2-methylthio-N6-dimethylallyladenosine synthase
MEIISISRIEQSGEILLHELNLLLILMTWDEKMNERTACILNYGCQMNEYESLTIEKMLKGNGFEVIKDPDVAELVILNTCTIRDNADSKILNRLEQLCSQKRKRKNRVIGVIGCLVASKEASLRENYPELDFLLPPSAIENIGEILSQYYRNEFQTYENWEYNNEGNDSPFRSYLPIQKGCNFKCSYCIVPSVKGEQISLPPEEIRNKAKALVEGGVLELTLLGQTINSYKYNDMDFVDLLELIASSFPDTWIRFLTSHPVLFDTRISELFKTHKNLCPFFHLPAQSGSTGILKAMKRGYSREQYLDLVKELKSSIPQAVFSTDMICGFPGETEEDFQQSLTLMEEVGFVTAFMFYYSERVGTPAAVMEPRIEESLRKERLSRMIDHQMKIQGELYKSFHGTEVSVLVESKARRTSGGLKGRTPGNLPVIFTGDESLVGSFCKVLVEDSTAHTLKGKLL